MSRYGDVPPLSNNSSVADLAREIGNSTLMSPIERRILIARIMPPGTKEEYEKAHEAQREADAEITAIFKKI